MEPPRLSNVDGPQLDPSQYRWSEVKSRPVPKRSARFDPHDTIAGADQKFPPSEFQVADQDEPFQNLW
jgi:hypothetical protein